MALERRTGPLGHDIVTATQRNSLPRVDKGVAVGVTKQPGKRFTKPVSVVQKGPSVLYGTNEPMIRGVDVQSHHKAST